MLRDLIEKLAEEGWQVRIETAGHAGFLATVWTEQSCSKAGHPTKHNIALGAASNQDPCAAIREATAKAELEIEDFKLLYDDITRPKPTIDGQTR